MIGFGEAKASAVSLKSDSLEFQFYFHFGKYMLHQIKRNMNKWSGNTNEKFTGSYNVSCLE